MKVGLVLGAGGVAGMNYHAGALHALSEVGGLDPNSADLVVGTSAGSVMGSLIRAGWSANECWEFALGIHPDVLALSEEEEARREAAVMTPGFTGPADLARRMVGSAYVLSRSLFRGPAPTVPKFIARNFPAGVFSTDEAKERFSEILPDTWPEKDLWLVAVDIGSGRRIVLGRRGSPTVPLPDGVMASCAIPGVFKPVRVGDLTLVDGGAHSTTNLDLAARAGCDLIIGIAPMAYDPARPPDAMTQLTRRFPVRTLATETRRARANGADVVLIRPSRDELAIHGRNAMRPPDGPAIALAAFDATARLLDTPRFKRMLGRVHDAAAAA